MHYLHFRVILNNLYNKNFEPPSELTFNITDLANSTTYPKFNHKNIDISNNELKISQLF